MFGPMSTDALKRFREGLSRGDFTMTEIADATGIPLTTLSDMKDADWRPKVLDRLNALGAALDQIKRDNRRHTKPRQGRAAASL